MDKILIVYPYSNISTNPTMGLLIESLIKAGYGVDVMLETTHADEFPPYQFPAGKFRQLRVDQRLWWRPQRPGIVRRMWHFSQDPLAIDPKWFRTFAASRYHRMIAVDPLGIATAAELNTRAKVPLVYVSFELLLSDEAEVGEEHELKQAERAALRQCPLILIQDPQRGRLLAGDNDIDQQRMCYVPVAPVGPLPQRSDDLRARLGIAEQQRIVLFQGTIGSWSGRDEWESLLACWPSDVTLVVHSRRRLATRHRKLLAELASRYPLVATEQPVSANTLATLTASADVGLVSYQPNPDDWHTYENLRTIGLASGKFASFMMCGVPVLANRRTSLAAIVETQGVGTVYDSAAASADALAKLLGARDQFSQAARTYYERHLDPGPPLVEFVDRLRRL